VSQTMLNYRGGPLSRGAAGRVQGGDRLPWVTSESTDNFAPLTSMRWQVHVYGSATREVTAWCGRHELPLHVFAWREDYVAAGLARDALYLVRPDTYVALAEPGGAEAAATLERYFAERRIKPAA